jgi:hypothetical protein
VVNSALRRGVVVVVVFELCFVSESKLVCSLDDADSSYWCNALHIVLRRKVVWFLFLYCV